jgi:hypothetical protein
MLHPYGIFIESVHGAAELIVSSRSSENYFLLIVLQKNNRSMRKKIFCASLPDCIRVDVIITNYCVLVLDSS